MYYFPVKQIPFEVSIKMIVVQQEEHADLFLFAFQSLPGIRETETILFIQSCWVTFDTY